MKVLITGATGFIGKYLCRLLAEQGDTLVILSRNPESAKKKLKVPCTVFQWNPLKEKAPQEAFAEVDAIIHLAGEPITGRRWSDEEKQRIMDSRVFGTQNLVLALRELSVEKRPKIYGALKPDFGSR